jgi:hypothetical protein
MEEIQKAWNESEKRSTNPANKKSLEEIQKTWNEAERKSTNPANKPKNLPYTPYKKGGQIKKKK